MNFLVIIIALLFSQSVHAVWNINEKVIITKGSLKGKSAHLHSHISLNAIYAAFQMQQSLLFHQEIQKNELSYLLELKEIKQLQDFFAPQFFYEEDFYRVEMNNTLEKYIIPSFALKPEQQRYDYNRDDEDTLEQN